MSAPSPLARLHGRACRPYYNDERAGEIYIALGAVMRRRRKELGLTQEQLAGALGLVRASVANIETGRQRVLLHTFIEITEQLGLTLEAALGRASSRPLYGAAVAKADELAAIKKHITDYSARQIARMRP